MDTKSSYAPNFVIKRTFQPTEAIQLLIERFAFLLSLGESASELIDMGAFYAYGVFAREAMRRVVDNSGFMETLAKFYERISRKPRFAAEGPTN